MEPTPSPSGRIVVVSRNAVADGIRAIAAVADAPVEVLGVDDAEGTPTERLRSRPPGPDDAVVLADHDAPGTDALLRELLTGRAGYVAMLASRRRAHALRQSLREEGLTDGALARLHAPAGLDTGGKSAGEIALSVAAQVVAWRHGRDGGAIPQLGGEPAQLGGEPA